MWKAWVTFLLESRAVEAVRGEGLEVLKPCTTYIYLLDDKMNVIIFYKSHFLVLETLKKLKEISILSNYLLYTPIIHGND